MPTNKQIEEEFDLLFPDDGVTGFRKDLKYSADLCCGSDNCYEKCGSDKKRVIKSFILQTIQREREAVLEELMNKAKKLGKLKEPIFKDILKDRQKLIKEIEGMKETGLEENCRYDMPHPRAYNKALSDIISHIKDDK